MCRFKSGIILKNRVILTPEGNESHSDLLESLNIKDNYTNASKVFVRAELIPINENKALSIEKWDYKVDQDIVPDWYKEDPEKYEQEFRNAVKDYLKDKLNVICCYDWTAVKDENSNLTYYFMNGFITRSTFGENNNYAESKIRKFLNETYLVEDLKSKFGNKLVPITTDLLALDGLDDYGAVEGDILAIPTLDLYRKFRKNIPLINESWWLATPYSTPSGHYSDDVEFVVCFGNIGSVKYDYCKCVRPFFVIQS